MNRRSLLRGFAAVPVAAPSAQEGSRLGPPVSLPKRDWRSTPFEVAVAFGESTTAGGTATLRELFWVSRLEGLINEIFDVLAKNCGCLSERAKEARKTFKPWRDESVLRKLY